MGKRATGTTWFVPCRRTIAVLMLIAGFISLVVIQSKDE